MNQIFCLILCGLGDLCVKSLLQGYRKVLHFRISNGVPFSHIPRLVISTSEELKEFASRLRHAAWVALDTEADSLHAYPEKLCLLQIAIPGEAVLVDPLADLHLEPLWSALDDREIIFHAADYDLRLLFQGHHFRPAAIFEAAHTLDQRVYANIFCAYARSGIII